MRSLFSVTDSRPVRILVVVTTNHRAPCAASGPLRETKGPGVPASALAGLCLGGGRGHPSGRGERMSTSQAGWLVAVLVGLGPALGSEPPAELTPQQRKE